ncbi:MAG: glycosyltransferase [Flavobacterium sp.]|nr:glycosyltransferase [Flavobacterium sp.]
MKITIIDRGNVIPPTKYGGTERVIWGLGFELNKLGHEINYIVPKGSFCEFADIIEYDSNISINNLIPHDTDFVHMNFVPNEKINFPYLVTMHGNPSKDEILPINTVFVSKNHAKRYNSDVFVYNGLLWDDYPEINLKLKRYYYHYLAKGSWKVKNLSGAAKIAIKADKNLLVMGAEKWKFYNFKRKPFFSLNPKIKYLGMVDDNIKIKIMQESNGLIFPVLWDEPFGLAIIESLYAGCPVFGTIYGSLPELINENIGFLSNDENEIIAAIKDKKFSPNVCHEYAKNNFNSRIMTENYMKLYYKILDGETLNKDFPYAN